MGERISDLGAAVMEDEAVSRPVESPENPTPEGSSPEEAAAEKPTSQTFEEIVAEVEAYFGGRIFTFKSHVGTASQIADMCPMAKMAFHRGKEFAISFLERFDGTPETKPVGEDEPATDEDAVRSEDSGDGISRPQSAAEQTTQATAEVRTEAEITITHVAQVAISTVMREPAKDKMKPQAPRAAKREATVTVKAKEAVRTEPEEAAETTPLPLPATREKPQPKQEARIPIEAVAPPKKAHVEVAVSDVVAPSELPSPATVDKHRTTQVAVKKEVVERSSPESAEIEATEATADAEPVEANEDVFVVEATERQEANEEAPYEPEKAEVQSNDRTLITEDTPQNEEASSNEVVEDSDAAADIYETIADQLGIEHETPNVPADTIEQQSDPETTTLAPLLEIIEEIIEQPEETQPLIKQHLVEVVRSIEILKWARSAEECREALDGLKTNLTLLFGELGYDDSAQLAIQLLERYNLQAIDEVMNTALKVAKARRSHSPKFASVRHALIGRHVMRLLFGDGLNSFGFVQAQS